MERISVIEREAKMEDMKAAMDLWEYEPRNFTLNLMAESWGADYGQGIVYQIDLEQCHTTGKVLDFIIQVGKKTWATPEILAGLVMQLEAYLDLQGNFCGSGENRIFNVKEWMRDGGCEAYRNPPWAWNVPRGALRLA